MSEKSTKMVCVYCGASPRVDQKYKDLAIEVGKKLAAAGYGLVYGGGRSGMMGLVADSALKGGAHVVGIIPGHIDEREIRHEELTELHVVDSMHERKQMMAERADAFLILPGGLGTMDEFFEITTWKQLGLHDKPIIILNGFGYYDHMLQLVNNILSEHFMKPGDRELFDVIKTPELLVDVIQGAPESVLKTRKEII